MDYKQAVDDVRKLTRYFESLQGICAALDGIASIDQARSEAQARLQTVLAECNAAQEQIAVRVELLDKSKWRVREAEAKAEAVAAAAVKRANDLLEAAKAECDAERKRFAAQADDAKRRANEAAETLAGLQSQIAAARDELGQITAKMDEAKRIARAIAA